MLYGGRRQLSPFGSKQPVAGAACGLDAGKALSYPGAGDLWTDVLGGLNFTLGNAGADAADPTWYGTPDGQSGNEYFSTDGGDYFTLADEYFGSIWRTLGRSDQPFTMELWAYLLAGQDTYFFSNYYNGQFARAWTFRIDASRNFVALRSDTQQYTSPAACIADVTGWRQLVIAGQINGAALKIFENGAQTTTVTPINNWDANDSGGRARLLAYAYPNAGAFSPAGTRLSIVNVYDRVLSDAEVLQNFEAYRGRFGL